MTVKHPAPVDSIRTVPCGRTLAAILPFSLSSPQCWPHMLHQIDVQLQVMGEPNLPLHRFLGSWALHSMKT